MSLRDDRERDPGLPIKLQPCSNGEYVPRPMSEVARQAMRRARRLSDDNARRIGMSRREFLLSAAGAATGLFALAACSRESGGGEGGRITVPPEATTEPTVAEEALGTPEFVFDVQTHFLEFDAIPPSSNFFGAGFPQAGCGEADARDCFSVEHWMEEVFLRSDTTMAVISAIPVVGEADPLSIEIMAQALRTANELCDDGRVLIQGHAVPDVGPVEAALLQMQQIASTHPIAAWKVYTHSPNGWFFDDRDPEGLPVGDAFLEKVEEIGVPVVAVHKGLSGGATFASPVDIGPAAVNHPGIQFLVYHSGFESGVAEGPYDPDGQGVDRLVRSAQDAGIGPGGNVYAELGSTWRSVMGSPDEAAHLLGKLLAAFGADNVLWGTDSIWYGSPQDQIQAFRAFEITEQFQDQFGYPALTPDVKAKILGGNAARLYGVEPTTVPCRFSPDDLQGLRRDSALDHRTYGPLTQADIFRTFTHDHPWVVA
ncbi:MAG: amidohydrolase family protein [Acidimicrobiales bacterium]